MGRRTQNEIRTNSEQKMAKYIMQEVPRQLRRGKRTTYPRLVLEKQITLRQLAHQIAETHTFSVGEIEGVLDAVARLSARYLGDGYSVKLDGIGTWVASLGLKEGTEPEEEGGTKRNAASIEIKSIHFRADKAFIAQAQKGASFERARRRQYVSPHQGIEERTSLLLAHLRRFNHIKIGEYAQLTGLSRSSASRELRQLLAKGIVALQGYGAHACYHLPEEKAGE